MLSKGFNLTTDLIKMIVLLNKVPGSGSNSTVHHK